MPIVFAAIAPHPPIILPSVGSEKDRLRVKKTVENLYFLSEKVKKTKPDSIIISSPHPDWGFNVPLFFLTGDLRDKIKIETFLIGSEEPKFYFMKGKKIGKELYSRATAMGNKNYGLIASGDLSHCLKKDGPYGFHPQGPKFDKELIESLKEKNVENILRLDEKYPQAGECGLRSFCFVLGILEASETNYQTKILSYEAPFGVGYLVADFVIKKI